MGPADGALEAATCLSWQVLGAAVLAPGRHDCRTITFTLTAGHPLEGKDFKLESDICRPVAEEVQHSARDYKGAERFNLHHCEASNVPCTLRQQDQMSKASSLCGI